MYCSECKLRVADDNVTVCPVCQGPLQSDAEDEAVLINGGVVGKGEPKIEVEDKFSAYEKPGSELNFNPEELGLQSPEPVAPDAEDDDIMALTDLWEDEDIDADLEGVLAEAFSLDEVDEAVEMEDELDLGEDGLDLGKPGVSPASSVTPVAPARNSRSPLLLLLLVVIGVGGASWFYFQNLEVKPGDQVVKPVSQAQSLKSASEPVAKDSVVEKVKVAEPVTVAARRAADDKPAKLEAVVPVRDLAPVEVAAKLKDKEVVTPLQNAAVDQAATAGAQSPVEREEVAALAQRVTDSSEKPEMSTGVAESVGEKGSDSAKAAAKEVTEIADKAKTSGFSADASVRDGGEAAVAGVAGEVAKEASLDRVEKSPILSYAIHIGSFKSQKRVSRQIAMLQKKGFAAYFVVVDLKEKGVWQRVMIPGGATREEAKVVQKELAELFPREESLIKKIKK